MNNKLIRIIPLLMLSLLLLAGNAFAWSLDITPVYGDQDQTDIIAGVGDTVHYEYWFNPDAGGNEFSMGTTWRIGFDFTELEWDAANSTQFAPTGFFTVPLRFDENEYNKNLDEDYDYVTGALATFPGNTYTFTESFLLADLAFTVINPVDDDVYDVILGDETIVAGDGFQVDGVAVVIADIIDYHHFTDGADIAPAAVPVPAAAWLLGSGLLGLVGLRRRNS